MGHGSGEVPGLAGDATWAWLFVCLSVSFPFVSLARKAGLRPGTLQCNWSFMRVAGSIRNEKEMSRKHPWR